MLINNYKYLIIIIFFLINACSSLDIQRHETDLRKEKLEADGRADGFFPESTDFSLSNLIPGNSNTGFNISITYEVALEKFSIMPIITADRDGGVITTDWYSMSSNIDERVKFNIIVKDDNMTNESLMIKMFKQTFDGSTWRSATSNIETANKIKKAIINQAMKLKTAAELS